MASARTSSEARSEEDGKARMIEQLSSDGGRIDEWFASERANGFRRTHAGTQKDARRVDGPCAQHAPVGGGDLPPAPREDLDPRDAASTKDHPADHRVRPD